MDNERHTLDNKCGGRLIGKPSGCGPDESGSSPALTLIIIILFFPLLVNADWNKADTGREILFEALHLVDWKQTLEIASNDKYTEGNPILGKYPSKNDVHLYMGSVLILHPVVSYLLPDSWREGWQYITIGATGSCVYFNFTAGIR